MKAVLQRVQKANVCVNNQTVGQIESGVLIFLGIVAEDTKDDIEWLSKKITNLRIFNDSQGVMNVSLKDHKGDALVVSQFTLHALTKKGNRPSYVKAARPETARPLYDEFVHQLKLELDKPIQTGIFGTNMTVELKNDGPVTIIIDSKNRE